MDVNELMIGDYVYADGEPLRVTLLVRYYDEEKNITETIGCQGIISHEEQKKIEFQPIPLTGQILAANGFVDRWQYGFQRLADEQCKSHLTYYPEAKHMFVGDPQIDSSFSLVDNISYVHQLQNALRICGFTKFADNLKLE